MTTEPMSLRVENLSLHYTSDDTKAVLDDIDFALAPAEIACLVGQSGCGKTSLLRCIAGFETPTAGTIKFGKHVLFDASTKKHLPAHQRQIGVVFQDYALFPHLTVADNIAFGLYEQPKAQQQATVDELLALVGLMDLAKRYPHELSGGQQQRVALARAIAPNPQLILFDEPFSSLDADLREDLAKNIQLLLKQRQISALVVTHDQQEAFMIADKIGMLAEGKLQQWDTPAQLYQAPKTATVAKFIGKGVLLSAQPFTDARGDGLETALGKLPWGAYPYFAQSQQVLIRPEWLGLVPKENSPITGVIKAKQFKGDHLIYEVWINSQVQVLVYSQDAQYMLDGVVGIKLFFLRQKAV